MDRAVDLEQTGAAEVPCVGVETGFPVGRSTAHAPRRSSGKTLRMICTTSLSPHDLRRLRRRCRGGRMACGADGRRRGWWPWARGRHVVSRAAVARPERRAVVGGASVVAARWWAAASRPGAPWPAPWPGRPRDRKQGQRRRGRRGRLHGHGRSGQVDGAHDLATVAPGRSERPRAPRSPRPPAERRVLIRKGSRRPAVARSDGASSEVRSESCEASLAGPSEVLGSGRWPAVVDAPPPPDEGDPVVGRRSGLARS